MNVVAKVAALLALSGYLPTVHAEPGETAAHFLARAVCETAANQIPMPQATEALTKESFKQAVIGTCIGDRLLRSLEYKKSLMPAHIYIRCTAVSKTLAESHDCIDRATFELPRGSSSRLWQLQNGGGTWVYWSFEECNTARLALGAGRCVSG